MRNKTYIQVLLIVLSTIVFVRPTESYLLTLLKSFVFQVLIGYLLLSVFYIVRKKWLLGTLSVCAFIAVIHFVYPSRTQTLDLNLSDHEIAVAHFNVLKINKNHDSIISAAKLSNADFLSFQEIDSEWKTSLCSAFADSYPYWVVEEKDANCFGLAVFSKHPFVESEVVYLEGVANITGVLDINGEHVAFIATHTNSPLTRSNFIARNKQIDSVGKVLTKYDLPILAIGDYNAVPWDKSILNFLDKTGLKDSRKANCATYPRQLGRFGIPIDYIFHSEHFACHSFDPIYNTSSDHAGIIGKYSFVKPDHL